MMPDELQRRNYAKSTIDRLYISTMQEFAQ
jgi:hypothetical protein